MIADLLVVVTDDILSLYEGLISSRGKKNKPDSLTQHEVLQELFNFKFIQLIIPRKGDEEVSTAMSRSNDVKTLWII